MRLAQRLLPEKRRDEACFHLLMVLWSWPYVVLEIYFRIASTQWRLAGLLLVWVGGLAAIRFAQARGGMVEVHLSRLVVSCAGLVSLLDRSQGEASLALLFGGALVLLIGSVSFSTWFENDRTRWPTARTAMVVAGLVFAAAPAVFAFTNAPWLDWPPRPELQAPAMVVNARPVADIVILFDEWNSSAAGPVIDVLRQHGFSVNSQSILPAADGTLKMTPRLFLDRDFDQARPCTPTALCSGSTVLDFARVRASRDDVDVVGFFQPYCAIQGLRYCYRSVTPMELFNLDRWRCISSRRLGWPLPADVHECNRVNGANFELMSADVLAAVRRAPLWKHGGMLFAHLPLPHPTAQSASSDLMHDYAENVQRAARFVDELIVLSAQPGGVEPRFLIFSDHPLRPAMWCGSIFYTAESCRLADLPSDTEVPLVLAARQLGPVPRIAGNAKVLELLREPPW